MSDKDEALRLAEVLDLLWLDGQTPQQAAACLRRQHAEIAALKAELDQDIGIINVWRKRTERAENERDALRETERKFGTTMHAVMAERDALRGLVRYAVQYGTGRIWFEAVAKHFANESAAKDEHDAAKEPGE